MNKCRMNPWHEIPFFRLFIPFAAGIFLGSLGWQPADSLLPVCLVLGMVELLLVWKVRLLPYRHRWVPGMVIHLFLFLAGLAWGGQHNPVHAPDHFCRIQNGGRDEIWLIRVDEAPREKPKSVRITAEVRGMLKDGVLTDCRGKGLLYLKKDAASLALAPCDEILVRTSWKEVAGPSVPGGFDYARYLKKKGVTCQAWADSGDWALVSAASYYGPSRLAWRCQRILADQIRRQSLGRDETAVGCAMILGFTEGFDPELQGAYSRAGVTHILSVSGLHVGLVFVVFNRLLSFLDKGKRKKLLKAVLLLLFTWAYALLTGGSPPVQRAAFMFSFLIVGNMIQRKNHILNTLFASAFMLLWLQPGILSDVGFQLSYLALLGIVLIHPVLYQKLYFRPRWADKIWELVSVSIAAQLATSPVAIFQFHQFPNWFIPANLLVIPLSTLVMYLGIAFLLVSPLPWAAHWVSFPFGWSLKVMNTVVAQIDRLPFPVTEGLYPGPGLALAGMIVIICLVAWMKYFRKAHFFLFYSSLLLFFILMQTEKLDQRRSAFMVFTAGGRDLVGIHSGNRLWVSDPDNTFNDSALVKKILRPYCQKYSLDYQGFLRFSDSVLLPEPSSPAGIQIKVFRPALKYGSSLFPGPPDAETVIVGGGWSGKRKSRLVRSLHAYPLSVWDLKKQGAFVLEGDGQ